MPTITINVQNQYGLQRIYVNDPQMRRTLTALTGKETLDQRHIAALHRLGFSFRLEQSPCQLPEWFDKAVEKSLVV